MQSRTRSMSMPAAGDGTPSRWSCALKSSEARSGISPPLDPAHEAARVEGPVWIEGLLESAHDRKPGWRRPPNVETLLDRDRGRDHHHLPLHTGRGAQLRQRFGGRRRRYANVDDARRGLGQHPGARRDGRHHERTGGQRNDGAKHHLVVRGRGPIAGGVPESRWDRGLLYDATGFADESDGLVFCRLHLPRVALEFERQGPRAPTPTLPRKRGRERCVVEDNGGRGGEILMGKLEPDPERWRRRLKVSEYRPFGFW